MHIIIKSTLQTLKKSQEILTNMSDETLSDTSIPPYYSSIGSHVRHILDFYDCILKIDSESRIDLTARSRNKVVETNCKTAEQYLNSIINKLNFFDYKVDEIVIVTDDLGLGKIDIPYTIGALFAQANSHTIHHYAIINYILDRLGIVIKDEDFGYNPTTPKETTFS